MAALTGAFGGGCSTAGKAARDERRFKYVSLSEVLKNEWKQRSSKPHNRADLQALGDEFREKHGPGVLARLAVEQFGAPPERLVVDGIRNIGETQYLRDRFGYSFYLVAVLASVQDRWARVKTTYTDASLSQRDFHEDDRRDRNEDVANGQQVQLCVAGADVFLDNGEGLSEFNANVASLRRASTLLVRLAVALCPSF
jgi:hypothetical protein